MRNLIVFDGDDTLWRVEHLYDDARNRAARIVAEAGLDASHWLELQIQIDLRSVETMGLSRQRFPASSVRAYEQLLFEVGGTPNADVSRSIWAASAGVFNATAPLVSGAREVVERLSRTHRLALLTQGDDSVQRKRVADSGLAEYFESIQIVGLKSSAAFSCVLRGADTAASDAWSVGNSLPSDIEPALQAGMSAVWVDAYVWDYEHRKTAAVDLDYHVSDSLEAVERVVTTESLVRQ